VLRRVEPDDIAVFFEQQADAAAAAMAAFPCRDRVAHDEHWARILGDSSCVARAIVLPDGQIVGNIGSCGYLPSAASLSSVRRRKQATRSRRSSCD